MVSPDVLVVVSVQPTSRYVKPFAESVIPVVALTTLHVAPVTCADPVRLI
jgi:hypothetical protein